MRSAVERLQDEGIVLRWHNGKLYAYQDGLPPERVKLAWLAKRHNPQLIADFLEEISIATLKAQRAGSR